MKIKHLGGTVIESYSKEGIDESYKCKQWIDFDKFLIAGTPNSEPNIVRDSYKSGPKNILNGYTFILVGDFEKSTIKKNEITSLITANGGTLGGKIENSKMYEHPNTIIISDDSKSSIPNSESIKTYNTAWLVDCVTHLKIKLK
ncbi:hypothetical protein RF11_07818 [Thelohanellus kitauei]|uniref:BRCT domain-containing protein n=1 Tax=Thelohanellus kitauei TaxID=669202 RepID=A0A0C2JDX4_THEKT|nr:hypothetical protein RF11_07818 [Thelohanellus kitauei]